MVERIRIEDSLSSFQNIVMFYKDDDGKLIIGNTWFYNRPGHDYMSVMYHTELPKDMSIMDGWNWLDDNDPRVTLVPEVSMETGIEDFLYAHGKEKDWKSVPYYVIDSYTDIEKELEKHSLKPQEVLGLGILKK